MENIAKLFHSPELFSAMSAAAAARVRMQSSCSRTVERELALFIQDELIPRHTGRGVKLQVKRLNDDAAA